MRLFLVIFIFKTTKNSFKTTKNSIEINSKTQLFLLSDLVCAIAQETSANSANNRTMVFMSASDEFDQPGKWISKYLSKR